MSGYKQQPVTGLFHQTTGAFLGVLGQDGREYLIPAASEFLGATGDFTLDVADNTATGGNARGTSAVDLQLTRAAATQVASGNFSTLSGGANNTVSGVNAVVAGGVANSSTATNTVVSGGSGNTASGAGSAVGGGITNTASGVNSAVRGGNNNAASGVNSEAGGAYASTNTRTASRSFGSGFQTTVGRYQQADIVQVNTVTGTGTAALSSDGAAASAANQLTLQNNSAMFVKGQVSARDTVTGDTQVFDVSFAIKRGAAAANTALVGTPTVTTAFADAAATGTLTVTANTTLGCPTFSYTGFGANAIRVTGWFNAAEVA